MVDNSGQTINVGGGQIVMNPGSGPVRDSDEAQAEENIRHFITDLGRDDVKYVRIPEEDEGDGRYAFLLYAYVRGTTRCHIVTMPGLPLDKVRFIDRPQDPWDFPRLYVDWSSWLWKFALNCCTFGTDEDDDA